MILIIFILAISFLITMILSPMIHLSRTNCLKSLRVNWDLPVASRSLRSSSLEMSTYIFSNPISKSLKSITLFLFMSNTLNTSYISSLKSLSSITLNYLSKLHRNYWKKLWKTYFAVFSLVSSLPDQFDSVFETEPDLHRPEDTVQLLWRNFAFYQSISTCAEIVQRGE